MEIPFYSAKDYTIDSVNGVCLCRCNNCGLILIDENPHTHKFTNLNIILFLTCSF